MSLTDQLAKVIEFTYYFLVYPLFRPAIKIYKRLLTGKLPFAAVLFLLALSILTIKYEDSRFVRRLFPGTAETRIRKVGNQNREEVLLFEDGALCERKEDVDPDARKSTGMVSSYGLRRYLGVWPRDPSDSSKPREIDLKQYESDKSVHFYCVSIEEGSATGLFAAWRRGPGRLLKQFLDLPDHSFPMRYVEPFIKVLFLEVVFLTFLAVVFMSFYTLFALGRLFMIVTRAYSPAETQKWAIVAEPAWDPVLIQISDTHVTTGRPPYEVQEDPQLWPHVPELNTAERLSQVFQEVNRLQPKPPLVVFTGDMVDLG
jgi:hypothetical protein